MSTIKLYELKKTNSEFVKEKIITSSQAYKYIKQFYNDDMDIYKT